MYNLIGMKEVAAEDVGKHSEVVEGRPVVEVSVGDRHDFNGGKLVISIKYDLRTNEVAAGLEVWHFDDNGDYVKEACYYDSETRQIVFTVDTLSKFAIMYQEPVNDNPDDPDGSDDSGSGMFLYIGIGAAAVVIVAGLVFFLIRRRA